MCEVYLVQLEWTKVKTLNDDQLEGKSGASSRGNSSSNRIYQSCCSWKARSRISGGLMLLLLLDESWVRFRAACHFVGSSWAGVRKHAYSAPLRHWEQIGVLKASFIALNILAWNDKVRLLVHFVGYEWEVMINRMFGVVSLAFSDAIDAAKLLKPYRLEEGEVVTRFP